MCRIAIEIPDEVLYETKMSKMEALSFARKVVALQYYLKYEVSLGYCSKIAGMDKEKFIRYLSENGVSIFHFDDEEELIEEMSNA